MIEKVAQARHDSINGGGLGVLDGGGRAASVRAFVCCAEAMAARLEGFGVSALGSALVSMSLSNATELEAVDVPLVDHQGRDVVVVVVKATFEVADDGMLTPADDPAPVRLADEPWDDDEGASLRYASDVCTAKRGIDVVVVGEAWSPKPVTSMDIGIQVAGRTIPLRVHGPRCFYRGAIGLSIGPAASFERLPMRWEYAYGGASEDQSTVELSNPVGIGVTNDPASLVDRPAPRIEHPGRPHKSRSDEHLPVGCAPVMSHWSPRRERYGTCDATWQDRRMPLPPLDHDLAFNNVAPVDLQFDVLAAGSPIRIVGMSERMLQFQLPDLALVARGLVDQGEPVELRPQPDLVIVEPTRRRVEVVARACLAVGRGRRILREIRLDQAT